MHSTDSRAEVGYIVPEYFRWPGYLSPEKGLKFADMPHGIAAVSKVGCKMKLPISRLPCFLAHFCRDFMRAIVEHHPVSSEMSECRCARCPWRAGCRSCCSWATWRATSGARTPSAPRVTTKAPWSASKTVRGSFGAGTKPKRLCAAAHMGKWKWAWKVALCLRCPECSLLN